MNFLDLLLFFFQLRDAMPADGPVTDPARLPRRG